MSPLAWVLLIAAASMSLLAWRFLGNHQRLRIDERGILDRSLKLGWIRWDEIEGAYHLPLRSGDALLIRLHPTERLAHRLGRRYPEKESTPEQGRFFNLRLDLTGTETSSVELLQQILAHGRES